MPLRPGETSSALPCVDAELVSRVVAELMAERNVVLTGPLGVGKTTTAAQACEQLTRAGYTVRRALDDLPTPTPTLVVWIDDHDEIDLAHVDEIMTIAHTGVRFIITTDYDGCGTLGQFFEDRRAIRINVPPLTPATVHSLILQWFHPDLVSDETIAKIIERVDGNSLLLRELLRILPLDGMTNRRGVWVWDIPVPPLQSIGTLLASRLAKLSADELTALRFVALEAPVRLDLCEAICGKAATAGLRRRELIGVRQVGGQPLGRVINPLYREAALATLDTQSKSALAELALDRITNPQLFGTATWLKVLRWTMLCSRTPCEKILDGAQAAADLGDAETQLMVAEACARYGKTAQHRLAGRVEHAKRLLNTARFDECAREIAEIEAAMPLDSTDPRLVIRLAQTKCDLVAMTSPSDCLMPLHDLATTHPDRSTIITTLRSAAGGEMNLHGALSTGSFAFAQLLGSGGEDAQTSMVAGYGIAATLAGREQEARQTLTTMLAKAHAPGTLDPLRAEGIMVTLAAMGLTSGRCREARALIADLWASTNVTEASLNAMRPLTLLDALLASNEGRWETANRSARLAAARYETADTFGLMRLSLATLALTHAALDDHAEARQVRADLSHSRRVFGIGEPIVQVQLALTSVWLREPNAAAVALATAEECRRHQAPLGQLRTLHVATLADAELLRAKSSEIRSLADQVDAPVAAPILAHCEARLSNDRTRADDAARELARMGVCLPAPSAFAPLSLREREVATLAALGYSSKAIATRLTVSPRTVETYLTRAFNKLGVTNREDLADRLSSQ